MFRVTHRHGVFTILDELYNYFYSKTEMLKDLQDGVHKVLDYWYKKNKSHDYEVGIIAVVYTFARELKWNPHIHAIVTEGAVDRNNKWWKNVNYIPYSYLRKS